MYRSISHHSICVRCRFYQHSSRQAQELYKLHWNPFSDESPPSFITESCFINSTMGNTAATIKAQRLWNFITFFVCTSSDENPFFSSIMYCCFSSYFSLSILVLPLNTSYALNALTKPSTDERPQTFLHDLTIIGHQTPAEPNKNKISSEWITRIKVILGDGKKYLRMPQVVSSVEGKFIALETARAAYCLCPLKLNCVTF